MPYSLDAFIKDICATLETDSSPRSREKIKGSLEELLTNRELVAATFPPGSTDGHRKLYEDKEQGFVVLAHYHTKHRLSPPHDHGPSWAIYGQAIGWSEMSLWQRTDGGKGEGKADLRQTGSFRLTPGKAGIFDVGVIHGVDRNDGPCAYIRVTGRDLDYVQRLKYDLDKQQAIVMAAATVAR